MEDFADFAPESQINHQALARRGYAEVQYNGGKNIVEFFQDKVLMEFKSKQAGREIWEPRDFIRIYIPGNKLTVRVREVTEQDKEEHAAQWAKYKAKQEQIPDGIPLESCFMLNKADVANLKALRIHTVEQLVNMPDGNVVNMGAGMVTLHQKVKKWYEGTHKAEEMNRLMARLDQLERDNLALRNTLSGIPPEQRKAVEVQADQPTPKKRGRPRKNPVEDTNG